MRYTEITKEVFNAIVTDKTKSFRTSKKGELAEIVEYYTKGTNLRLVINYTSAVTQYYLLDINF